MDERRTDGKHKGMGDITETLGSIEWIGVWYKDNRLA
jgi:hypothetical protein